MMEGECIWVDRTDSTNLEIRRRKPGNFSTVACREQTSGRGQRGNTWESQPGMNLTFSMIFYPPAGFPASRQFEISMAAAMAVAEFLKSLAPLADIKVKWPNDIYAGDHKICGILIENSLEGQAIVSSIIGIGININQREFLSDAPNPVSVANLTEKEHDPEILLPALVNLLKIKLVEIEDTDFQQRKTHYFSQLWRGKGYFPYIIADSGNRIMARIKDIEPDGHIQLETSEGATLCFAFKEVKVLLGNNQL